MESWGLLFIKSEKLCQVNSFRFLGFWKSRVGKSDTILRRSELCLCTIKYRRVCVLNHQIFNGVCRFLDETYFSSRFLCQQRLYVTRCDINWFVEYCDWILMFRFLVVEVYYGMSFLVPTKSLFLKRNYNTLNVNRCTLVPVTLKTFERLLMYYRSTKSVFYDLISGINGRLKVNTLV